MSKQEVDSRNNLADRIIAELDSVISQTNTLQSFSIIASYGNSLDRNVSPVHFVPAENCLGLESWCAPLVFTHSQETILKLRKETLLKQDLHMINKLNMYLNAALLIQPEVTTLWNIKRELLSNLNVDMEMQFSKLVLSHKPKSSACYSYRESLIRNQQCFERFDCLLAIREEFKVIEKAVDCQNNYHAWNHRIWCIKRLLIENFQVKRLQIDVCEKLLFDELNYSQTFVMSHVSEHSSFYFRQHIIHMFKRQFLYPSKELIRLTNAFNISDCPVINSLISNQYLQAFGAKKVAIYNQFICLMIHELIHICRQLNVYFYGHEAIWYHRRFVLHQLFTVVYEIHGICIDDWRPRLMNDFSPLNADKSKDSCCYPMNNAISCDCPGLITRKDRNAIAAIHQSTIYKNLLIYERDFMHLLTDKITTSSLEFKFIERHKNWLRHIINVDLSLDITLADNEKWFNV